LFEVLGTLWGGDGVSTFAIPDFQGRIAAGSGTGPLLASRVTGEELGVESYVLTPAQLPGHAHSVTNGQTGFTGSGTFKENHQPTLVMRFMIAVSGIVPTTGTTNTTSTPTIGEIRPFATDGGVPSGWMFAEGQLLTTASNPNLFAVIGNAFGGDGVTNFALPDLRGRTPIGAGQGTGLTNRSRGDRMGADGTAISLSQVPPHTHAIDPTGARHPGAASSLLIKKNAIDPATIDLSWGTGCSPGVTGYAVYQGIIGSFYSHVLFAGACDVVATSLNQQTPCATNCYYLVSAVDDLTGEEGSLGTNSSNVQIPRPASPCQPAVDLAACP
jgi:microcystin-dependent protein